MIKYDRYILIPKNKRGNKSDSNNYRQIAFSSLLCKLFDIIITKDQHHGLIIIIIIIISLFTHSNTVMQY